MKHCRVETLVAWMLTASPIPALAQFQIGPPEAERAAPTSSPDADTQADAEKQPKLGGTPTTVEALSVAEPIQLLGALQTGGSVRRLDVEAGHAYLCEEYTGVTIVDVSEPTAPQWRSSIPLGFGGGPFSVPAHVYDLDVAGDFLYVANNDAGLRVFDVSDPASPVEVVLVDDSAFGGAVLGVYAAGVRLYVLAGGGGVSVWDVSDPYAFDLSMSCANGTPTVCATGGCADASLLGCFQNFPLQEYYRDAVVRDGRLYAAGALYGLVVLDVTDPAAIQVDSLGALFPGQVMDVAVRNELVVGASLGYGMVGAPAAGIEPLMPTVHWPTGGTSGAEGVELGFDRDTGTTLAYVATGNGLEVVDVTDPAAPEPRDVLAPGVVVRDAMLHAGLLYVAAGTKGLRIYTDGL